MNSQAFTRFLASALLLIPSFALLADEIFPEGSFEAPAVEARTPKAKGGDPSNKGEGPVWSGFDHKPDDKGGRFTAGLTNEIARTGRQSLYFEFDKLTLPYQSAVIQSAPIAIVPLKDYRVSIWGRLDAKNPLSAAARTATVKVEVDFYKADKETQVGESVYAVQPLPGIKGKPAVYSDKKWTEFWTVATAPEDAAFMIISWRWESGPEEGEANGVIYFDDVSVQGPAPVPEPSETKPVEKK